MQETSAGVLVYRLDKRGIIQVLLGKNGGPRYENKNVGVWNIPKGHVENGEDLKKALKRELKEELGINVTYGEMEYIGNIVFWHRGFPSEKKVINRENNVDLFVISSPKEVCGENIKLTNYEKHYHFYLMSCSLDEINGLLKEKNNNEFKVFTDVELNTLIEEYKKYRKEDNYVG